jgi:hypothetical protein
MADRQDMRVLVVAPFERGEQFGGSQRATAIAERLEERRVVVDWLTARPRRTNLLVKLHAAAALRPGVVDYHARSRATLGSGSWHAAIAVHSYMAPHLERLPAHVARVLDFQNLEWRALRDVARATPRSRRAYLSFQSLLMRRFERRQLRTAPLALFPAADDLAWGRVAGAARALLVPNRLPAAAVADAAGIAAVREDGDREPTLIYLGTLAYPPHYRSLAQFLSTAWPRIVTAHPDLRLLVIGRCRPAHRRWIETHQRVETTGFVERLTPLLWRVTAAVVPDAASTGTLLRVLYFALAGIPIVGSPSAFRGLPGHVGWEARTPDDWARAVAEARGGEAAAMVERARRTVMLLQEDPSPWDELRLALDEIGASSVAGPPGAG